MKIAEELEVHAGEELQHALIIAKQIDYLGGMSSDASRTIRATRRRGRASGESAT